MADPLAAWHTEHINFSSLLDLLEKQVTVFHLGEAPDYELMTDILYYMRNFADRVHHPPEDVAYARLVEHDPGVQLVVSRLLQEHRVIAAAGEELLTRLNEVAADSLTARAPLEAATATYLVYYRHHLSTEERDIMPRAAQVLTVADWAAVAASVPTSSDPLFGDNVLKRFEVLRNRIEHEGQLARSGYQPGDDLAGR
ncbi:hemerythrin domain-containing protein [Paraburkholderia graminis]|uniref:hemerythrin domain-containing protein n=1 Tax=Paraburkholderia graminis TaxID=60548 RepID=UPI0038B97BF7